MTPSYLKVIASLIAVHCIYLASHAQKKLAIIGSSTSDCYGLLYDSCYVGRLQQYYAASGNSITIEKLAVSGSNVYQGMPTGYVPPPTRSMQTPDVAHNITAALQTRPDVILVNYPSNGYDVYSVAEAMYCLRTIKQVANSAGVPCYITTTQPRSEPASYSTPGTRRKMAEIKDSILNQFGAFAINFWNDIVNPADSTIITSLGQGDGTHLNPAGHKLLTDKVVAKNIFSAILPVTFTGVSASVRQGETVVVWTSAGEENVRSYEVQQSADGVRFTAVRQVSTAGRSASGNRYTLTCTSPAGRFSFYRVAALYPDGKVAFSPVIKVLSGSQSFDLEKLTRSGTDIVASILANEKGTINLQVVGNTGQVLIKKTASVNAGVTAVPVSIASLSKGIYFIRFSDSQSGWQTRSFIKE